MNLWCQNQASRDIYYLGSVRTDDGKCDKESYIGMVRVVFQKLNKY